MNKQRQQAGAVLCQAHEKLGLAKTDLPVVLFNFPKTLGCLPSSNKNEVVFHFLNN
jgi:hypothetical protein